MSSGVRRIHEYCCNVPWLLDPTWKPVTNESRYLPWLLNSAQNIPWNPVIFEGRPPAPRGRAGDVKPALRQSHHPKKNVQSILYICPMKSEMLLNTSTNTPHTYETHIHPCALTMLLRSTQGGCRDVTTHCSSSVRVLIRHRASHRTQEPTHIFGHGTAVHLSRKDTLSVLDSRLARNWKSSFMYEDCCLLLYLDMNSNEYWRYWCCCTYRVVPHDHSLVVASFVPSHSRSRC